ncbi:chromate transporter [Undibacterium griseum]|uniref:Chromate transporter n=1 Tax=Undibacterium griseum TaxID=2762295 RepID=A0ABR6YHY9_9BURK|nr:chromate transporter [Undibacterium griseum]MBC3883522.1 chromate transporter [Undibacterium griseum]
MSSEPTEPHPQPASLADLFFSFTLLALQGFGGVLAIVQHEIVERKRWLTPEEFVEDWAVAQIMPGPNVMNLSMMVGSRYFGLPGAITALAGMLLVPMMIVLLLALVYAQYAQHPGVTGALRGMSAVTSGLIFATGLKLIPALNNHPLGRRLALLFSLLCFICVALFRLPLVYVLPGLGSLSWFMVYRKFKS